MWVCVHDVSVCLLHVCVSVCMMWVCVCCMCVWVCVCECVCAWCECVFVACVCMWVCVHDVSVCLLHVCVSVCMMWVCVQRTFCQRQRYIQNHNENCSTRTFCNQRQVRRPWTVFIHTGGIVSWCMFLLMWECDKPLQSLPRQFCGVCMMSASVHDCSMYIIVSPSFSWKADAMGPTSFPGR